MSSMTTKRFRAKGIVAVTHNPGDDDMHEGPNLPFEHIVEAPTEEDARRLVREYYDAKRQDFVISYYVERMEILPVEPEQPQFITTEIVARMKSKIR